jgi:hypothetical protein
MPMMRVVIRSSDGGRASCWGIGWLRGVTEVTACEVKDQEKQEKPK